jgi:hypothetical protein
VRILLANVSAKEDGRISAAAFETLPAMQHIKNTFDGEYLSAIPLNAKINVPKIKPA